MEGAVLGSATVELFTVVDEVGVGARCTYLLAVALLTVRRRWPLAAVLAALPAAVTGYLWLAPMFALSTAAAVLGNRLVVYACALLMFLVAAIPWCEEIRDWSMSHWVTALLGPGLFSAGPLALGRLARIRGELSLRVRELTESRERERLLVAQEAVAAERARLAREMHDAVSHHVNLISVEAGVLSLTADHADARQAGQRISALSSTTLDELRDMLGVLRSPSEPEPSPGLAELPALIASSGLDVNLASRLPSDARWSAATELAAYRTVQESLTNAAKHAPGSRVTVTLTATAGADRPVGELTVEVHNGPPATGATPTPGGAGHGLVGLRERAALLGGTVTAERTDDGGHLVRACLP